RLEGKAKRPDCLAKEPWRPSPALRKSDDEVPRQIHRRRRWTCPGHFFKFHAEMFRDHLRLSSVQRGSGSHSRPAVSLRERLRHTARNASAANDRPPDHRPRILTTAFDSNAFECGFEHSNHRPPCYGSPDPRPTGREKTPGTHGTDRGKRSNGRP